MKISNSITDTSKIAKEILSGFFKKDSALVLALIGDLGGGKTTFTKELAKHLGVKETVLSPTFVIYNRYDIPGKRFDNLYHFDCYRIQNSKEIKELGFDEVISNKKNIVVIEWADIIKDILPKDTIYIYFEFVDKNKRKIYERQNPNN